MRCSWLLLAIFLSGCAGEKTPVWRRLALLPIENLAADPAFTLEGSALRLALWDSLQAQPGLHVVLAGHRRDLPALQPASHVEGYVDRGRFQLRLADQDVTCLGSLSDCAPKLAADIGRRLGVSPRPSLHADTLLQLAKDAGSFEDAAKADPGFSIVWLSWAAHVQRAADVPAALALLRQAPVATMPPFDAARVRLRIAELQQDRTGRSKALVALAAAAPADLELQDRAAREAASVRDLDTALAIYRRIIAIAPAPPVLNQAAYVAALAGDQSTAEKYAAAAQAAAPADPSYVDTRGEIAYFFGQFAAASQHFEQASALNITFLNGVDLWKAADAALRAGDRPRAAQLLARFLDFQTRSGRRNTLVLQAVWDWHSGAADEAVSKLQTATDSTERGKALFYLALASLNRKDLVAAQQFRRQMDANTIEAAFLSAVIDGTPPPPGLPVPPEALSALNRYVHGDNEEAKRFLAVARTKMDPIAEGQWRKLDALVSGGDEKRLMPASPDDWLAFLLR